MTDKPHSIARHPLSTEQDFLQIRNDVQFCRISWPVGIIKVLPMSNYTEPVTFTKTNQYGSGPADEDDVYTVDEFRRRCEARSFIDYDGHGHPVKGGLSDKSIWIYPSRLESIPADATHIIWFNR